MWLLLSAALAQDTASGGFELEVGERARVQTLPQVDPLLLQWVIHGSTSALSGQLPESLYVPGVASIDLYGVGGGSWMVGVRLVEPGLVGGWRRGSAESLILEFREGSPVVLQTPKGVDLDALIAKPPERVVIRESRSSLQPLPGISSTLALHGAQVDPAFPIWTPNLPQELREILAFDDTPGPYTVDRYKQALSHPEPYVQGVAMYRLAQAYQEMGMPREAAYYFRAIQRVEGPWPKDVIPLMLARAQLQTGDVDGARQSCVQAWGVSRARPEQVVTCLGLVSLESADPAPAPTGRVLASVSGHPLHLLLAAQLLLADGYAAEAMPLLQTALATVEADNELLKRRIQASLGDAYLHLGELDEARDEWRDVGHKGPLGDVVWLRQRTLVMVRESPGDWPAHLPDLDAFVAKGGPGAAEALYLQAQVAQTLGDDEAAADALVHLMDHHRRIANASEVPAMLWQVLVRRLESLHRQGRGLDLLTVHRRYWRGSLEAVIQDPSPLALVVQAYDAAGMADSAMRTQRELFSIQTRLGQSDSAGLLRLAGLYEDAARHEDALRTLDFLAGQGVPRALQGPRQLLLGRVLMSLDRGEEGEQALVRALRSPESKLEAQLELALLASEGGDCVAAMKGLLPLTQLEPEPDLARLRSGEAYLVLARCQLQQDQAIEAAQSAKAAAGRSPDEHTQRYATYLAVEAARSAGEDPGILQEALETGDDLWAELARAKSQDEAFQARLDQRRGGPLD